MVNARDEAADTIELRCTDDGPRYRVEPAGELWGLATSLITAPEGVVRTQCEGSRDLSRARAPGWRGWGALPLGEQGPSARGR